jgi:hypothetical protein
MYGILFEHQRLLDDAHLAQCAADLGVDKAEVERETAAARS